jgi:predicted Zn finger-like uncharacterized protein
MDNQPPTNCPNCGARFMRLVDHEQRREDGEHFDLIECDHCGTRWTEVYKFTHIEITLQCTSTDPTDHQGDTCPIHEA